MVQNVKIDFNPDLFNEVYWELEKAHYNNDIRYIWLYGGSSASKTYSEVQFLIKDMLCGSDNNAMVLRKFATDIRDSIYSDFKNIIDDWGLNEMFICQQNYIKCVTGSFVRFRGLDNSEKIKGLSNFKYVVLEEVSQFDEIDFKQVKKRLRGRVGQKIIGIFNPISEEHWIKKNVFDNEILTECKSAITGKWENENKNTVILKTNYTDNKYIVGPHFKDVHVIADFEKDKITDYNYYLVYGLGNWGKIRTGGEFWKDFNTNNHVRPAHWNENLPIHLTFDENVNPYLTCLVWQIEGKTAIQIDEICLEDPRNRLKHVCAEFQIRYPQPRVKGLFIYGDRTSWKEDTKKEKGENFFTDITNMLREYRPSLRLQSVNPSVVQSGGFINQCYSGNTAVTIIIGDKCKKSINDYQYALEDSDGTIKKTKKTHPVTKVVYEEYGHCFVGETLIITKLGEKRIDEVIIGDFVLTRKGFKKVTKVFNNGIKKVNTYNFSNYSITCTSEHKVFCNNKFISVNQLRKGIFCIFDKKTNKICYQKLSLITGLNLQGILSLKKEQKGNIIQDGLIKIKKDFIDIFMNLILAIFRKGIIFIIKTVILKIIILKILNVFWRKITLLNIIKEKQKNKKIIQPIYYLQKQSLHLKSGISQKMGLIGIKNKPNALLKLKLQFVKYAQIVKHSLKQKLNDKSIAQKNAIINTRQGVYEQVYDIQVDECHEYFANGILVHNCSDAKRYFITTAFANEYEEYKRGGKGTRVKMGVDIKSKNSY